MGKINPRVTIYQKPTCTTCRETVKLVKASGCALTTVNYYEQPFTKAKLRGLLRKAGLTPKDVLRTKEEVYKTLGLARKNLTEDAVLDLMVKHPDLIQRPLVETGNQAMLARPAETVRKFLK